MSDAHAKQLTVISIGIWALLWAAAIGLACLGHLELLLVMLGISVLSGILLLGIMYSERNIP